MKTPKRLYATLPVRVAIERRRYQRHRAGPRRGKSRARGPNPLGLGLNEKFHQTTDAVSISAFIPRTVNGKILW